MRHLLFVLILVLGLTPACGPSPGDGPPADLIVTNGRIFPADGTSAFYEALAVRGDRIAAVGTAADVDRLRGPGTQVIDAQGGTVVPGFNDPHFHMFLELESGPLQLLAETTLEGIQNSIRAYGAANAAPWVLGQGWLYSAFPGAMPTRAQLDALVPDRPAFLRSYDYHTAWVNSKALALAGITKTTPNPEDGIIGKDPATGEPTGILKENAQGLVMKLLPPITLQQRRDALAALIPKLHQAGVTSVQTADSGPDHFETYEWARNAGVLQVRVFASISPRPLFDAGKAAPLADTDVDRFDRLRDRYKPDALFRIGIIKLLADGVVEPFTAALLAPYSDRPDTTGLPAYPPQELQRIVALLDRRGWPMMIHSIGDAAVRMSLDAFENAAKVNPPPARGRRHRVEHLETIDPSDVPRFGSLGVLASMHPEGWTGSPLPQSLLSVWARGLGPVRAGRFGSWAPVTQAGGRVLIGSDWPAAEYGTVARLYTVASPIAAGGNSAAQLSMAAAVQAYTSGPAYAAFEDDLKGTLTPGKLADIVILSRDIFAQPLPPVKDVGVRITIFGGKVVYRQ
ncbi:MAG TPA: amidohydrolase [Vicinamibacterales bacterium]|nr:amidohydrolase [Vicinamibacterales bacterium]